MQSSQPDSRANPEALAAGYKEVRILLVELRGAFLETSTGSEELWPTRALETAKGRRRSPRCLSHLGSASASRRLNPWFVVLRHTT